MKKALLICALIAVAGVVLIYTTGRRVDVSQPEKADSMPQDSSASADILASGSIEVVPELAGMAKQITTVFVIVRSQTPGGPPFAVVKLKNEMRSSLPFEITTKDVMGMGGQMPADPKIVVRFDIDGSAGPEQPGDLVGELGQLQPGQRNVVVQVDRMVKP